MEEQFFWHYNSATNMPLSPVEQQLIPTHFINNIVEDFWESKLDDSVSIAYTRIINDMYDGVRARIRTLGWNPNDFSINIGLHQDLALNLFLKILVMDKPTRGIQGEIPCYMLFVDYIVLIDETS